MKWPWEASTPPLGEPQLSDAMKRRLDELEEKWRRQEERQGLQEKGLKALELDWQEWFDKFRLMYARLSKRIKDASELRDSPDGPSESRQDAPGLTIEHPVEVARGPRRNYG